MLLAQNGAQKTLEKPLFSALSSVFLIFCRNFRKKWYNYLWKYEADGRLYHG